MLPDLQAGGCEDAASGCSSWRLVRYGGGRAKSCLLSRSPLLSERILLSEALQSIRMSMLTQAFLFIPLLPIFNRSLGGLTLLESQAAFKDSLTFPPKGEAVMAKDVARFYMFL